MDTKRKGAIEMSTDTRILINILEKVLIKEANRSISYAELSSAIGRDVQGNARGLLKTARKHVEKENHIIIDTVRNEGLEVSERYSGVLEKETTGIRRRSSRTRRRVLNAIIDKELAKEESKQIMARLSVMGVVELCTKPKLPKKLCDYMDTDGPKELPTAETLKLFL